jgi:outer membrane protein assembly factor BamE (lipoprotein component of BamABCDE complex)
MNIRTLLISFPQISIFVALLAVAGCTTSGQTISETSMEERIANLRVGQSTKADVERILGLGYSSDRNRWSYNFSDTAFDISERKQGPGLGIIPVSAGVIPTNTRAVVSVAFNAAGVMKHLEVNRLFDQPFINDYWFALKDGAQDPLDAIAKLAESTGMKVAGLDKEAGMFTLEDNGTKAKIQVKLDGQILRLTTRNPHHRLASEYRAFSKRESLLTGKIADSEIVQ